MGEKVAIVTGASKGIGKACAIRLAKDGMTMAVVTHEMGFAREVGNRVLFMADGQLLEQGSLEDIFGNPQHPRLKDFLSKVL